MSDYIFTPRSIFLNSLFLGDSAGSPYVSPVLRQITAANKTADGVRDIANLQREAIELQQNAGVSNLSPVMQEGFDELGSRLKGRDRGGT